MSYALNKLSAPTKVLAGALALVLQRAFLLFRAGRLAVARARTCWRESAIEGTAYSVLNACLSVKTGFGTATRILVAGLVSSAECNSQCWGASNN